MPETTPPPPAPDTEDAVALIERLWAQTVEPAFDATHIVESFIGESAEAHAATSEALKSHLRIYDQFVFWSIQLSTLLNFHPLEGPKNSFAYRILSGAITSLLLSIRSLVISGHDMPAKQLVRSLGEYCDTLHLLIVRPDLVEAFATPNDWKASNEFWHRYVKSGKARKAAFAALNEAFVTADWFKDWMAYQASEDEPSSLSIHPSFISAYMACYFETPNSVADGKIVWPGYLGAVGDQSIRTLSHAANALMALIMTPSFPFGGDDERDLPALVHTGPHDRLARRITTGRFVLIHLLEFLQSEASKTGVFMPEWRRNGRFADMP